MFKNNVLSMQFLDCFNFDETKKNVFNYFKKLEKLQWEWTKLNSLKGVTANYDFSVEYKKQPYSPIGKDEFSMSAKENKEESLKKWISSYYWAIDTLSDREQKYITECFMNRKNENEYVDLLGFNGCDDYEFKKFKKNTIYKFADFLNLVVEKC